MFRIRLIVYSRAEGCGLGHQKERDCEGSLHGIWKLTTRASTLMCNGRTHPAMKWLRPMRCGGFKCLGGYSGGTDMLQTNDPLDMKLSTEAFHMNRVKKRETD